jgi:hypothetical protein
VCVCRAGSSGGGGSSGDALVQVASSQHRELGSEQKTVLDPRTGQAVSGSAAAGSSAAFPAPTLRVMIDGPYGNPSVPLHEYESVVLVCGGIGVTPCASLLADFLSQREGRERPRWHPHPRCQWRARRIVFSWCNPGAEPFAAWGFRPRIGGRCGCRRSGRQQGDGCRSSRPASHAVSLQLRIACCL